MAEKTAREARRERIGAFAHIATLGLMLAGIYEASPMLFGIPGAQQVRIGEAAGEAIDHVAWLPVSAAASLIPALVEATRRIPRRVGVPRIVNGSWKVPIGRAVWGRWVYHDFGGSTPHSIVAGSTKYGKSSFLKCVLYVLCQQQSPQNLHVHIIDLKGGASFAAWKHAPHVHSVERDLNGARAVLESAEAEMWHRLNVIEQAHAQFEDAPKFPRLFVVIDEGSLLKLDDACMEHLQHIAAIGREPRVHLIYGTQRPSADILPVVIRDQMEGRFVFTLNEPGSSGVVLGEGNRDAYRLSKHPGRMIYRSADAQAELQAAYVDESRINAWLRGYADNVTGHVDRGVTLSVDAEYSEWG